MLSWIKSHKKFIAAAAAALAAGLGALGYNSDAVRAALTALGQLLGVN